MKAKNMRLHSMISRLGALLLFIASGLSLSAQEFVTTFGIQYKPIIPVQFFRSGNTFAVNDSLQLSVTPKYGSSIGMVVRKGINNRISLEGGINLVNRNYLLKTGRKDSATTFEQQYRWVSYEIPLQVLVFIRLGEQLFLNGASGISLDFFPSDVEGADNNFYHRTFRRKWFKPSLVANLGTEWRTVDKGYFYLGASYHQPFTDMAVTQVSSKSPNSKVLTFLNGSYLTIDFRYFFHEDRQKFKRRQDDSDNNSL
jgi:hypothetical protein